MCPLTSTSANDSGLREAISYHIDSSDEDEQAEDEPVSNFDQSGVQRCRKRAPEELLVIPSQLNPDWREAARRRRGAASRTQPCEFRATPSFVPDSARAATGTDGSVGSLGTKDTINSGPQLSGLQIKKRVKVEVESTATPPADQGKMEAVEETEDQRALRAILAGDDNSSDTLAIPVLSEVDALKQDVEELPNVATADDYARVPISVFGVAMLRGMGWKDGTVASKSKKEKKNGVMEPYLPQARPNLLGIGAKERELDDHERGGKKLRGADKRYIPVVRKENGIEAAVAAVTTTEREKRSGKAKTVEMHRERRARDGHWQDRGP
ncbi:hypothetical protein PAXRUDRAFT_148067 [Paxillus rubicundulus Ve08.2h10]|uniref:G-patch domain-containing protein n=1 Tax=Paxillus rubicundulus Ve08.2h10 TaxID=930991 RepID=A0A0D0E4D4_9AGAM|nr:hypothetical protein PAXRUDRAFT_148067 [Paxillus rubicundulus Ve08.2h10]